MRARYIGAAHVGHSGRALIGVFSSLYSENVICDSSSYWRARYRTLSHRRLNDLSMMNLNTICQRVELNKIAHFPIRLQSAFRLGFIHGTQ
jgi:hypothetical protein